MNYIKKLSGGKSQVMKDIAFCTLLNNKIPPNDKIITELIEGFDIKVREQDTAITREALSNVHGDWYEWLLAISAWNYVCENKKSNIALLMPNVMQFDVTSLYIPKLYDLIVDLKQKVIQTSKVQLITSNPDFVIISRELADKILKNKFEKISKITLEALENLENIYSEFKNQCSFDDIVGYISVKTSLRPDRRLQIPHEGSLMKALYTHLQTREWITNPKGLKYYAISTKLTEPDRQALKTVATHSLTTVFTLPQAAVDDVFEINSLQQAHSVWEQVLL